ncbi:MAG: hypothetical protein HY934_02640 [Candidatus Firestonebacteria bacterium]|nr:hypothetical protein [Candidatus Firestonebacteria bacterium]
MYILGLNPSIDASAAIIDDKNILAASDEERFQRIKHYRGFPVQSMKFCLEYSLKKIKDIDAIAVCWNPGIHLEHLSSLRGNNIRHYTELLIHIPFHILKELNRDNKNTYSSVSYIKQEINIKGNSYPIEIYYLNHHLCHAASAFFLSPFKHSAILTMDGYGEETSILLAYGENNIIKPIKEIYFPISIGSLYGAITQYLGFIPNFDENKVMGLAAWGKPVYYTKFKKIIKFSKKGCLDLDLNYFSYYIERRLRVSSKFIKEFGSPRLDNEPITQHHKDIASSLQKILIDIILELMNMLYDMCKEKNLCLAGGVALNCSLNGFLYNRTPFSNIFIPPIPGDNGNSLGAALYLKHVIKKFPYKDYPEKVYLGTCYKDVEIEKILIRSKIKFKKYNNPELKAAQFIAQNKIIGWFQGRMEFGPRALGNRSILAHPGKEDIRNRLDKKIKFRNDFEPYAPAILKEKYNQFFENNYPSPYMSFCTGVIRDKYKLIKNVIHNDFTGRIQIVDKNTNFIFYNLLKEFEKLTGLPIVLNTSLNTRGEPIVNTIEEALKLFFTTDLDAIFLGKYLIEKQ